MGWITQVASIPEVPPLTKGFTVGHTPMDLAFFSSPILGFERMSGLGAQKGERERAREERWFFFFSESMGEKEEAIYCYIERKENPFSFSLTLCFFLSPKCEGKLVYLNFC